MSRTEVSLAKRRLVIHDSLTFLVLILITIVLFFITLFLFRSFTSHRAELATRWSERGRKALLSGKPQEAIVALRTGLSYAPDTRAYQLLLAQALEAAGHTDEATNYFMSLWVTQPGDGFINLELARLAAKKNDPKNAIKYYRASIYGTWEGDGVVRRRDVRLELARYLIDQHNLNAARIELLIAAGNSPSDPALNRTLAGLLFQTGDMTNALSFYQKSLRESPRNQQALEGAARAAYMLGRFDTAHSLLERALEAKTSPRENKTPSSDLETMLNNSKRVLELQPSNKLRPSERVSRILRDRAIARKRFDGCVARFNASTGLPPELLRLKQDWAGNIASASRAALLRDPAAQDAAVQLIYDTEMQATQFCGVPSGDDALLLLLAQSPEANRR
ncbi:MAG TPA: tetratricopeptide repeat protein [Edaphobacter sp.]|nr:tetratricopeptide repeat protein [Edaphobacter sp.]